MQTQASTVLICLSLEQLYIRIKPEGPLDVDLIAYVNVAYKR